ncbi:MAG: hypothetical protein HY369_03685 [Candidatus Aenigmarchaeota archaeon]|nr:hypothetical protein [Candidatus Aenigmarchaeota archaeon]
MSLKYNHRDDGSDRTSRPLGSDEGNGAHDGGIQADVVRPHVADVIRSLACLSDHEVLALKGAVCREAARRWPTSPAPLMVDPTEQVVRERLGPWACPAC